MKLGCGLCEKLKMEHGNWPISLHVSVLGSQRSMRGFEGEQRERGVLKLQEAESLILSVLQWCFANVFCKGKLRLQSE